jgi:hypothetical protein
LTLKVELRCATLPGLLRFVAVHCWFVVFDQAGCHRWEIWQSRNAGGRSTGHLHCDLKPPDDGVGGGPTRTLAAWQGDEAAALKQVLESCERDYPFCQKYWYWPGPNSNTFAAWVLRKAGITQSLGPMALGKRYPVA